jgi:peptidyl-prolyl cis-trans isomerase D
LGLGVSDEEIAQRITQDPNFRGPFGQFDRNRFEQLIRSAGYTEPRYVAEQRQVMLRRQIGEAVGGELPVPKTVADAMHRYESEQRAIDYLALNASQAGEISAPTPEALSDYFEKNKNSFRAPEYRKLAVLSVSPEDLARWMTVSDDDARKAYDSNRSRYTTAERRHVQQIVFPNQSEAKAAAERLGKGEITFEALAAERVLKPTDIDLGILTKSAMLDPKVADAAFALKEGDVSAPVDGRFGATLVRVIKIEPSHERSYEEAAPEIKRQIALDRGKAQMLDLHDKVEDAIASGMHVTEAASKLSLVANTIGAVDRSGRDPNGSPAQGLPAGVDLMPNAFSSEVGVENAPLQIPNGGYVWYEVLSVTPSRERTLDEVKDKVETRWRQDQIAERLKAKAAALVDKLNGGASMLDVAANDKLKVETASGLQRGKTSEALSAGLIDQVFRTPSGKAGAAQGQNETEQVVFRVTDVKVEPLPADSPQAKRINEALQRAYADDVLSEYVVQLQNELGVTINETALRQVIGGGGEAN